MRFRCLLLLFVGLPLFSAAPPPRPPFDADRATTFQQESAKALGVEVQLINSIGIKLALIPAGQFTMGSRICAH